MTPKDYILIAAAIRDSLPACVGNEYLKGRNYQAELITEALAEALERDNSRFDVVRFLEACATEADKQRLTDKTGRMV